MCQATWETRESFLNDPALSFNGYQPDYGVYGQGFFYFTHNINCCGSTMSLDVENFLCLYACRTAGENKQLSTECAFIFDEQNPKGRRRDNCENSFIRQVSQAIEDRFKS